MTAIGTVTLNVADLNEVSHFYQHVIGLQVHRIDGKAVHMGAGGDDLLTLIHTPDRKRYPRTTGLYHLALRVPSRHALALSLNRLLETGTYIQGASDHIVSEALYLPDPEGNGIEIYRDRPRDAWYDADGTFQMGTFALDADAVINELRRTPAEWRGLHPKTDMGHIHLHVADIPETRAFYTDVLGMDVMADIGSALFMSYDGYHHDVGANIWAGRTHAPADALGLDHFVLRVSDAQREHIINATGYTSDIIQDPSGNRIALEVAAVTE